MTECEPVFSRILSPRDVTGTSPALTMTLPSSNAANSIGYPWSFSHFDRSSSTGSICRCIDRRRMSFPWTHDSSTSLYMCWSHSASLAPRTTSPSHRFRGSGLCSNISIMRVTVWFKTHRTRPSGRAFWAYIHPMFTPLNWLVSSWANKAYSANGPFNSGYGLTLKETSVSMYMGLYPS